MSISSLSSAFLSTGPQVHLTSPQTAVGNVATTVRQLTVAGGVSLQTEGTLEQQLVKEISAANPGANQGTIAVIAQDLNGATSAQQIQTDLDVLNRMIVPTTSVSGLQTTVTNVASLLRLQATTAASSSSTSSTTAASVNTILGATALQGATTISVTSATGLTAGDSLQITLDTGELFYTSISSINGTTLTLPSGLPHQASNGNSVVDTPGVATYTTTLANAAAAGTSSITLTTAAGISIGDSIQLQLDSGFLYTSTVTGVSTTTNIVTIAGTVPSTASVGNNVGDRTNPATAVNQLASTSSNSSTVTYISTLTANALAGATSLSVDTVAGLTAGDNVTISLDNGGTFQTQISSVDSTTNTVAIAVPLTSQASTGQTLSDNVNLFPATSVYSPSATIAAILGLQLRTLIAEANPTVDLTNVQKDVLALSDSTLSTAKFQQTLDALNTLWTNGLKSSALISILA